MVSPNWGPGFGRGGEKNGASMFVFFGTKTREEQRGIVAEHCPRCGGVRPFKVIDYYHVGHLYYISVGRGSYQSSVVRCVDCQGEFAFVPHRYAEVIPTGAARNLSFEDLVGRSNPDLLQGQASLPAAAGQATGTPMLTCRVCGQTRESRFQYCPSCGSSAS